jgi:hypothetical protein
MNITLGADPEIHLVRKEKGTVASSIRVLGVAHDKHNPILLGDGVELYWDNVLSEFRFPPANSTEGFTEAIRTCLRKIKEAINPNYEPYLHSAVSYSNYELRGPRAKEVGCTPNHDCYTGHPNEPKPFNSNYRTGSFHVHVGHPALADFDEKRKGVILMDLFVGLAATWFDRDFSASIRRTIYGRAGEYRPTHYGIEYRVLGPRVMLRPDLVQLVADLTAEAMGHIESGQANKIIASFDLKNVREAINGNDSAAAGELFAMTPVSLDLFRRVADASSKLSSQNVYHNWGIA